MRHPVRSGRHTIVFLVLLAMLILWLSVSGLLVFARGDPEAVLRTTFSRSSRADAFEHLNGIAYPAWLILSSRVLIAIAAARFGGADVLAVLVIGPVIALVICLLNEDRSDPNWFVAVAVCTIGWMVSTFVGGVYWGLRRTVNARISKTPPPPPDDLRNG
jgi:hypothetical protein